MSALAEVPRSSAEQAVVRAPVRLVGATARTRSAERASGTGTRSSGGRPAGPDGSESTNTPPTAATASGDVVSAPGLRSASPSAPTSRPAGQGALGPAPTGPPPDPRVRWLPTDEPARTLTATGPAHVLPPTLEQRVETLRVSDAALIRESDDEARPLPGTDPRAVAAAVAQAALECVVGTRSVAQLARWVTPGVYEALVVRAGLTRRVLGPAAARHARVRRIRVWQVDEHTHEASVVLDDSERVRAAALRLESHRGSWRATALELA